MLVNTSLALLAVAPSLAQPSMPIVNPATWVTAADYPADALRDRIEGLIKFKLSIDTAGRVSSCAIQASSGSPSLDWTTCSLLTRRARFTPATDKRGRAIKGFYSSTMRWVIPGSLSNAKLTFAEGERTVTYTIKADGTVTDCTVTGDFGAGPRVSEVDGSAVLPPQGSQFCPPAQLRFAPIADRDGTGLNRRVRVVHRFEIVEE